MTYRLQTSGELRLLDSQNSEVSFPEKGLLILAYLLASGERDVARTRISRLVWGGPDLARGLTNLRQTVARIVARQEELGLSLLEFSASQVRVLPDVVSCDIEVLHALQQAAPDTVHALLGKAITFYRHPFLADLPAVSTEYGSWVQEMQHRCCEIYTAAIRLALPQSRSVADEVLVREAALRVFRYDPENMVAKSVLAGAQPLAEPAVPVTPSMPSSALAVASETRNEAVGDALGVLRALYQRSKEGKLAAVPAFQPAPIVEVGPLPRLAILPPAEEDGGVVSALLEDVTIGLCGCRTLRIVAPYTAQRISRQSEKAETIIRHAIHYVLDTRITVEGGNASLFAQLIYVANDEVIWADRYRLDPSDYLINRREIARQVVGNISAAVGRNEDTRLYYEGDPAAYFHFLEGQKSLQSYTLPSIRRAR